MDQSFPSLSALGHAPTAESQLADSDVVPDARPAQAKTLVVQEPADPRRDLVRLSSGLGFAALYGLSLGARAGGVSLLRHALSASAGLAVVGALGMPSLFVLLALVNAPVSPGAMLAAGARALRAAGSVLAGLAPSAALLAVTIESPSAAALVARAGLALAGAIGLYQLIHAVRPLLRGLPFGMRMKSNALLLAFCVFAVLLAARVWSALPILLVAQ